MKLVLFDIDGTLLTTDQAGVDAANMAFSEIYDIANDSTGTVMSGQTGLLTFQEALDRHQLPGTDDAFSVFNDRYLVHLRYTLQEPHRQRRLMPGIPPLLDALAEQPDIILGLVTGNPAMAAQLKLEAFGIWHYFRVGAYGDDAADRNALVPIAQERTRTHLGHDIPAQRIFVVGDTPRDIACARAHNAWAIAVATGSYEADVLQQHEPDHCLPDLGDIADVMRIFTRESEGKTR